MIFWGENFYLQGFHGIFFLFWCIPFLGVLFFCEQSKLPLVCLNRGSTLPQLRQAISGWLEGPFWYKSYTKYFFDHGNRILLHVDRSRKRNTSIETMKNRKMRSLLIRICYQSMLLHYPKKVVFHILVKTQEINTVTVCNRKLGF